MEALIEIIGSPWIPALLLFVGAFGFRLRSRSWFAPSAFAGLLWSGYLCCSLLALGDRARTLGFWALLVLVLLIQTSAALAECADKTALKPSDEGRHHALLLRIRRTCVAFILISLGGCVFFVFSSLEEFHLDWSFVSLLRIGGMWTLQRYDYVIDPWPLRIAAIWPYPAAILGGMMWGLAAARRDKILALLSLIPSLLISFLLGGRTGFLLALAFWLSSYWATDRARGAEHKKLINFKNLAIAGATGAGLLFFFILIFGLRDFDPTSNSGVILAANQGQIKNYLFGSPVAFSNWFDNSDRGMLDYGALTFPGLYDFLGLHARTIGTYTEFVSTTGPEHINIFTIFRGLIQDFTLPGTFFICAIFGFFSGRAYSKPSFDAGFALTLSAYYSVMLFSPLYNIFGFNSSILTWVVAWFVLKDRRQPLALQSLKQFSV